MIIWGSGTKNKHWALPEGKTLLLTWRYSHLFWCPIAHHISWQIVGDIRSEDRVITKEEAFRLLPGIEPDVSFWNKFGGYVLIGGIVLLIVWSSISG